MQLPTDSSSVRIVCFFVISLVVLVGSFVIIIGVNDQPDTAAAFALISAILAGWAIGHDAVK